jgi:hypothetical protein
MGNALAGAKQKLIVLEQDPLTWRLEHVIQMWAVYKKEEEWDFGVEQNQLKHVIESVLPDPGGHDIVQEQLWRRYYDHGDAARNGGVQEVNILEVFCGLAIICLGAFEEKTRFCFDLFDFDGVGSLSYDDLVAMLYMCISGTVCIIGRGTNPTDAKMNDEVDHIYDTLGIETHERVPRDALLAYYEIRIIELAERRGVDLCDTAMVFLLCYDSCTIDMLEDTTSGNAIILNSEDMGFD